MCQDMAMAACPLNAVQDCFGSMPVQQKMCVSQSQPPPQQQIIPDTCMPNMDAESVPAVEVVQECQVERPAKARWGAGKGRCAELSKQLETGGEARSVALESLRGRVRHFAFDASGCRVVQLALQVASRQESASLLDELRGHVHAACGSPHANYVLQKAVEVLPTAIAAFISQELAGVGAEVARHRYGCRIMCRLVEHHSGRDAQSAALIDEVLVEAMALCRDTYGHHVILSVLEHGTPEQRHVIASALLADTSLLVRCARNQHASFVLEKALAFCSEKDRDMLAIELVRRPRTIPQLADSQFGCYVVRALLKLPSEPAQMAQAHLRQAFGQLKGSKFGRRVLDELPRAAA
jgi:pumilio RNA-binding family